MVPLESEKHPETELSIYRKTLCCYINFSIDSVISNAFEAHRTGNRLFNFLLYSVLSVRHMICRCRNPYRIRDIVESFSEVRPISEEFKHGGEEDQMVMEAVTKGAQNLDINNETVVFETKDFTANPVNFVGTNIPSFYGGLSTGAWDKYKFKNLLPQAIVQEQDQ